MERNTISGKIKTYLRPLTVSGLFLFSYFQVHSQSAKPKEQEVIAIRAGAGIFTFHGDVGSSSLVGAYSFIRAGYSLSFEKYFNKNFSLSFDVLKGKIARDEKSSDNLIKSNFESPVTELGLSGTFLVKGKNEEQTIVPFASAGIYFLHFDPHGDLLDANGNPYYYWTDGSIKDMPQGGVNYFYAKNISRDYKYETKLSDSSAKYSHSTVTLPVTAGIKIRLTTRLDANLGFTYHFAFTDHIDNVVSKGNDVYLFSSASLTWHIFTPTKEEKEKISNVDFSSIDNSDNDKDGIMDSNDQCPGTPKDVKVDAKGCPIDSDADGVPDYLDKELHSKTGATVDANGVELTKAQITAQQKQNNNIQASSRKYALSSDFNQKPSAEFMKQVEEMQKENRKKTETNTSKNSIPYDLRIADWNKDGLITSDEIAKTIDSFFDGSISFSAEQINRLIDYFFEQ